MVPAVRLGLATALRREPVVASLITEGEAYMMSGTKPSKGRFRHLVQSLNVVSVGGGRPGRRAWGISLENAESSQYLQYA